MRPLPSTYRLFLALLITTVIPLGGCMSSQLGAPALLDSSAAPRGTSVTVANHNWSDVRVYALLGATRYPLGFVGSERSRTFTLPRAVLGTQGALRLVAVPLGGAETHVTDWIPAAHGETVEWTLAARLKLSWFVVR